MKLLLILSLILGCTQYKELAVQNKMGNGVYFACKVNANHDHRLPIINESTIVSINPKIVLQSELNDILLLKEVELLTGGSKSIGRNICYDNDTVGQVQVAVYLAEGNNKIKAKSTVFTVTYQGGYQAVVGN